MQGKKKINILLLSIYRNGGIRILFEYAKYLKNFGYDVRIYHTLKPYRQSENESRKRKARWRGLQTIPDF